MKLYEAEDQQKVDRNMIDQCDQLMNAAFKTQASSVREVIPRLIPFGEDPNDQYRILETIADAVGEGTVSLDLTHGFRHFGMIGFLSSFMLERVRNLRVQDLWYGALDMTRDELTPVLKLSGSYGFGVG